MLVRTAPETQNKPIHATENRVPYAPRPPHPTTTTNNNNQPTADTNQTGHLSKQHRNHNTTRPDQQPQAMRIQSRRHPTCFTQSWKSSRNDIRRESRSRGNRVTTTSDSPPHRLTILLPGPVGRVPQETRTHTPVAFQLPGGRPPGPPDAPPNSRGSALHPLLGGARSGPAGRPAVRLGPSIVHRCPPHPAAEEPPRRVRRGAWPPERGSQNAPDPAPWGGVAGAEADGGVPPRPPCRRGGRRRGKPLSTAARSDRLCRRPPARGPGEAALGGSVGPALGRPPAPGAAGCPPPPPGVPGGSPSAPSAGRPAARAGGRGRVRPPGAPAGRVQVPRKLPAPIQRPRGAGVPSQKNL